MRVPGEIAMSKFLTRGPLVAMLGAGLLLGGCATKEAVEQAQSTADAARQDAAGAMAAAQKAQATADSAASAAQAAAADAQKANERIEHLTPPPGEHHMHWRHHHHHHMMRHHHHHHHATTTPSEPAQPSGQPAQPPSQPAPTKPGGRM